MQRGRFGIKGPCGAFTFVELMAVLFVLSLMLAIVLPYFHVTGDRLNSEARQVASVLRYLNETAALRKETMQVRFDLDERTISWTESGSMKTEAVNSLRDVNLQSRGSVEEGELTVFFAPLGLREFLTVRLGDEEEEKTVTFNPVSGRVKIVETTGR